VTGGDAGPVVGLGIVAILVGSLVLALRRRTDRV